MFKWNLGCVYIVKADGLYKIGSSKRPHKRIAQLRTASPFIEPVHHIQCFAWREVERFLHRVFASKRVVGEWFALNDADLDRIASIDYSVFVRAEREAKQDAIDRYEKYREHRKSHPTIMEKLIEKFRIESDEARTKREAEAVPG